MFIHALWIVMLLLGPAPGVAGLTAKDSDRQASAVEAPWKNLERELAEKGFQTDAESLVRLAESSSGADLRWAAVEILGLRGEQSAKTALRKLVAGDPSRLVQETAALALARLGDRRAMEDLRNFLGTAKDSQRELFLAGRLAELGDPSGFEAVSDAAKSDDARLRFLSVGALVPFVPLQTKLSGPDPVQELLLLARDKVPEVRRELLVQLPFAVRQGLPWAKARPVVEGMARGDVDPEIREKAHLLLVLMGSAAH